MGKTKKNTVLSRLNLLDLVLMQLVSKAHEKDEAKHGVKKMIHHLDWGSGRLRMVEVAEEDIKGPEAGMGVGFDTGRTEDL